MKNMACHKVTLHYGVVYNKYQFKYTHVKLFFEVQLSKRVILFVTVRQKISTCYPKQNIQLIWDQVKSSFPYEKKFASTFSFFYFLIRKLSGTRCSYREKNAA